MCGNLLLRNQVTMVSPLRGFGCVGWHLSPGFAVLRTASPGVTYGVASPRRISDEVNLSDNSKF